MTTVSSCPRCGRVPGHPSQFCLGYALMGIEDFERFAANVYNDFWDQLRCTSEIARWESEGGR